MKFERTEPFKGDYRRLSDQEKALFFVAVQAINKAYEDRDDAALPTWPASLRIKSVKGADKVFEMTWSFSGPDGRATFEFIDIEGEPAILWRRIGNHDVFRNP